MASNIQKPSKEPCVIVGAACRVPGATNTHALWEMLEKRKDVQQKMPADRYNADAFYHTKGSNKGTVSMNLILFHRLLTDYRVMPDSDTTLIKD
jgi:hypothetical protein